MAVSCPCWELNSRCQWPLQQTWQLHFLPWRPRVTLQDGLLQVHQQRQHLSFSKSSTSPWFLFWLVSRPSSVSSAVPTCAGTSYRISSSDTCQSISMVKGISTYDLLKSNSLSAFCGSFPTSGTLCIPSLLVCNPYTVKTNDTCSSIQTQFNIIYSQITAWNPELGTSCTNIGKYVGYVICVSNPGGTWVNPSSVTTSSAPTTTA